MRPQTSRSPPPFHPALRVLVLFAAACAPAVELGPSAQLTCEEGSGCPAAWHCATAIGRCVRDDNPDHTGPSLQRATAESPTELVLDFGEPLFDQGIEEPGRYVVRAADASGAADLEVRAAFLRGPQTVVLATSAQTPGRDYRVAVQGLYDLAGNEQGAEEVGFTGFGERPDSTPPELLSPPPEAAWPGAEVLFVWSPKRGASSYTLEISLDEGMATPLIQHEVAAPETSARLTLNPGSFFWRVRSDLSAGSAPSPLHVFSGKVHVFCPAGVDCAGDSDGAGTPQRPFRRIAQGMELAVRLGLPEVAIAARGDGAAYDECVVVSEGLEILGGYDASFTSRDPVANRTLIATSESPAMMVPYVVRPTRISGLHLTVDGAAVPNYALVISNSSGALVVDDCEVEVAPFDEQQECVAVIVQDRGLLDRPGPTLRGNRFSAGGPTRRSVALSISSASPTVVGNLLSAEGWNVLGHALGVHSEGTGVPILEGNTLLIEGTKATGIAVSTPQLAVLGERGVRIAGNSVRVQSSEGVGIDLPQAVNVRVEVNRVAVRGNTAVALRVDGVHGIRVANNLLIAGAGEWEEYRSVGIEARAASYSPGLGVALEIVHNTVILGRVGESENGGAIALELADEAQPSIVNNLILALPSPGTRIGIWEEDDRSDPVSVRNNALIGFEVLYRDDRAGDLLGSAALSALDGQAVGDCTSCPMDPQSRVGDNLALALTAAEIFEDWAGADGSVETLFDAGLRLGAGAPASLLTGALDASGEGYCLPQFANGGACLPVTTDAAGAARTPDSSIGAFERD